MEEKKWKMIGERGRICLLILWGEMRIQTGGRKEVEEDPSYTAEMIWS